MDLITTTDNLASVCGRLARETFIAVDTEFMRETTYWPELCLIQMAGEKDELLIDALAPGLDLSPFFALMADERITKVFHAARQDLEIMYLKSGRLPKPIFDTQVAAMVCGFGESISFSNLAKRIVDVEIDKTSQFTDWRRRPLSPKQLTYALGDVTHLRPIYRHLARELERSGRTHWLEQELSELTAEETYALDPEHAWQRLKLKVKSRRSLGVLIEVAIWREKAAQGSNVPRGRILKDDALYDVANQMPQSVEQLGSLRSLHDGITRSAKGRELVEAVKRGLQRDPASLPPLERSSPVTPEATAVIDLLKVLLKAVAAEHGVASKLIATSEDLERIATESEPDVHALAGWRRELFGERALALKSGRLALAVSGGAVQALAIERRKP
jgi:ribonuclease D